MQKAGLVQALSGSGPFTVFAPTNEAFQKLAAAAPATYQAVLANPALLTKVLTYHAVAGAIKSTQAISVAQQGRHRHVPRGRADLTVARRWEADPRPQFHRRHRRHPGDERCHPRDRHRPRPAEPRRLSPGFALANGSTCAPLRAGVTPGPEAAARTARFPDRVGAAYDALADGPPLAALQAHFALLRAPGGAADVKVLRSLAATGDRLARGLAIRPLARFAGSTFDSTLHGLAQSDDPLLREQALWALADRPATPAAVDVAVTAVAHGGHPAVIAQLAIEHWAASDRAVASAVATALEHHAEDGPRVRLVEAASVVDRDDIRRLLARLLGSAHESEAVRAAAARALAASPAPMLLDELWDAGSSGGPELRFACARALLALRTARAREAAAALARSAIGSDEPFDRLLAALLQGRSAAPFSERRGIRIAQVFLQGRLDGELTNAGVGDGGGISTLLVQLGRALGSEPEVARVVTIARALAEPETDWRHTRLSEADGPTVSIERVPFGPAGYLPASAMWEHRLELERALETAVSELGGFDVAHLRFADAGAFAAARVFKRLGVPVAFTAAPDPHAVIAGAQQRGELDP